jgi:hypothetical protein
MSHCDWQVEASFMLRWKYVYMLMVKGGRCFGGWRRKRNSWVGKQTDGMSQLLSTKAH